MNQGLRILAIGHSYVLARNRGIPRSIASHADCEVSVAAPTYFSGDLRELELEPEPAGSPLKLVPLDTTRSRLIHVFGYDGRALKALLEKGQFDVIHVWEEPYIYAGYQIGRAVQRYSRARLIFRTAQNLSKRYPPPFSFFEKQTLACAHGWIAGGQLVFDAMLARGYDATQGRVLPLGIDTAVFHPLSSELKAQTRAELGLPPESMVIGFLGRLTLAKGVRLLLRAVEQLPPALPWSLLFLGSGLETQHILRWARKRGWEARVRVRLVRHDEVPRFLGAVDVLAAPSQTTTRWKEQFGRMIIEAFACGVPVIGSDSGEISNVMAGAGVVLAEADSARWAAEINAILVEPEYHQSLAQSGLARAHQFDEGKLAEQYTAFYRYILSREPGAPG
jgi:glycosyltransferase involved in cell wall biosynthesis